MDSLRAPLALLGCILIVAGSVLLLYVAVLVYMVLTVPGDVAIAQYILSHVKMGDLALSGTFHDPNDATRDIKFEMNWSESVRTMSFLMIGVVAVAIMARILQVLITCGTALVKVGMTEPKKKESL